MEDVVMANSKREQIEWTDEMDSVIVESIKEKGVSQGLMDAGSILDMNWYNCRNRWYKVLKQKQQKISKNAKESDNSNGKLLKRFPVNLVKKNFQKLQHIHLEEDVDAITNLRKISKYIVKLTSNEKILTAKLDRAIAEKQALEKKYKEIEEHYKTLLRIINQARLAAVDSEIEVERDFINQSHKFQMEQNGNLLSLNK